MMEPAKQQACDLLDDGKVKTLTRVIDRGFGDSPQHTTIEDAKESVMSNPHAVNWIYAIDDATLPEGHMAPAYPNGVNVVLARVGGEIYAVSGRCAHMGCPLFMGKLEGYTVTCPCHDWRFDIRTGKFLNAAELGLAVYSAKSDAGRVFVNLN